VFADHPAGNTLNKSKSVFFFVSYFYTCGSTFRRYFTPAVATHMDTPVTETQKFC
jgi:hypothetical protein